MTRRDFLVAGVGFLLGIGATIGAAFLAPQPDPLDCIELLVCEPMDTPPAPARSRLLRS